LLVFVESFVLFTKLKHSRLSDFAFCFHRWHRWSWPALGGPHLFALVYHIGGCKARRVAKTQALIPFTFAAC
jgi:hypothetical protein